MFVQRQFIGQNETLPLGQLTLDRMIRCRDKKAAWTLLARSFASAVRAEQSAFLVASASDGEFFPHAFVVPSATCIPLPTGPLQQLWEWTCDREESAWCGGLVGRPSKSGNASRPDDKLRSPAEREIADALFNQSAFSLLWSLVRDRRGFLLGVLLGARLWPDNDVKQAPFGIKEMRTARWFADLSAGSLENLRILKLLRDLRRQIHQAASKEEILRHTLRTAVRLLRVDSGRVVTPDGKIIAVGDQGFPGQPAPSGGPESQARAEGRDNSARAESVLRADIVWGRESRSSGKLELDARSSWSFDDEDRDLLEWVARHSASDCELVEKKLALDDWAAELHRLDDPFSIADKILVRIKQEFQFEGGLVYRAFPRAQRLLGFAGLPHGNRDFHASPYIYSLTEDSAATYAFKHEAFSTWDGQDSRVNQEGRKYFEFEGSLFAVPLGEANNRFGAVVVWKKHDKLTDAERAPIESRLKELTRQAASALRLALFSQNTESRRKFQERVAQLLQQMMQESELDKNLRAIMPAIAESGFTRIRLYRVRFGDRLVGEMAQGMGELQDLFEGSSRYEIQIVDNYYTKLMFDGVCAARKGDPLPENLLARLYPRKDEQTGQLAQDGSAERLNKPGRMPWAEVPVLSGGKLYGLIAADKLFDPAPSSDTNQAWGEITDVDLDALDVFAQLAGRAFEMDEKRGMLVQRHLRVLDDFVGPTEPVDLVRRRLLCFLTHGEEGLGYPRAALFLPAGEARHGVYRFCQAVGAANKKEFEHVAPAVCLLSLSEVLRNASLEHDVALNASLRDFEIDLGEDVALGGPTVVAHSADAHGAEWVARLKALGWDQFFVARLIASNQDVGLLVADKTWDHFGLNKSDEAVLDSAARHAAQILVRHGAVAQRLEDVHYVAKGVMHEFRTPLIHIRSAAEAIEHPADIHALPGHVDALKTAIEIMNARLGTMESAFFNTMPTANTEAGELLRLDDELKNWMDRDHVKLTVTDNAPGVRVQVRADAIRLAVNNLVRNSLESFKIALKPAPTIELRADVDGGRLRLSVADNGRGVSKQVLEQLMDLIPRFSTKNTKKEGGFGLFLASWIVRKHGGALKLHSSENVGFSATILLPID